MFFDLNQCEGIKEFILESLQPKIKIILTELEKTSNMNYLECIEYFQNIVMLTLCKEGSQDEEKRKEELVQLFGKRKDLTEDLLSWIKDKLLKEIELFVEKKKSNNNKKTSSDQEDKVKDNKIEQPKLEKKEEKSNKKKKKKSKKNSNKKSKKDKPLLKSFCKKRNFMEYQESNKDTKKTREQTSTQDEKEVKVKQNKKIKNHFSYDNNMSHKTSEFKEKKKHRKKSRTKHKKRYGKYK
jgi:hypothetical protein